MSTGGVRDLFRTSRIRETTIIIMLNQFVRGIINYGFLFNIGGLGGNIYYNNIINNLTGIPAFLMLCCTGLFSYNKSQFGLGSGALPFGLGILEIKYLEKR